MCSQQVFWCVIEFDDGVQLVPQNWIRDVRCFWPTYKSTSRYEKAVRTYEEPKSDWPSYAMKILGTYDSYEAAKPKLKIAEEQSDLASDAESKQTRKNRRRKIQDSSSESEDEEVLEVTTFPPIIKNVSSRPSTSTDFPLSNCSKAQENSVPNLGNFVINDEEFKKKVTHDLSFLKVNLIKVLQKMDLLNTNKEPETIEHHHAPDFWKTLPLLDESALNEMETKLRNDEKFKQDLIFFCSRIGGYKVDEITKLILRKLFSDSLAATYSWIGAKKKRLFSNLALSEVIIEAVRKNKYVTSVTDKEIIDCIKNWLRHAKSRANNKITKSVEKTTSPPDKEL